MSNQEIVKKLLDKGILPTAENIAQESTNVTIVKPRIDDLRARVKIVKRAENLNRFRG